MGPARLVLMRHAKSAYPEGVPDHDRPLNARGMRDAQAAAHWFAEHGAEQLGADPAVRVSSALRTQMNWDLVRTGFGKADAHSTPAIYEAVVSTLVHLCAGTIGAGRGTLVIGHNPGIEQLADFLADPAASAPEWSRREKYPTSGIAVLDFKDDSWAQDSAIVSAFVVPRG